MVVKLVSTKALLCALALVTPILFFKGTNELFEFPKMIFVYILGSTAFFVFIIERIKSNTLSFTFSKLDKYVLLFLGANVLSTIFSINRYTSTWGYYTRFNGGLVSVVIFTMIYFVFVHGTTKEEREKVLDFVLYATVPVCIYAIAQSFGFEKGYWEEDSSARVFASLGQPNWLAAYLVLTIFPALSKMLAASTAKLRGLFATIVLLNYFALWFTYSLSGLLGFVVALVVFLIFVEKNLLIQNKKTLLGIFLICILVSVLKPGILGPKIRDSLRDAKIISQNSLTAYAAEEQVVAERKFGDTTAIRLAVWQGTLRSIVSSPKNVLVGTGPETFPYAFPPFRPEELNQTSEWDFVFNKPHNYYLELLSNLGLLGLALYLVLLITVLKSIRKPGALPLVCGILGLAVSDFFGWHTVTSSLVLILYIGLIGTYE